MTREEKIKSVVEILINQQDELKFLFSDYSATWYGAEPTLEEIAALIVDKLQ